MSGHISNPFKTPQQFHFPSDPMAESLPQETFDLAAKMLRKHTQPEELRRLIAAHKNTEDKIKAAIPTMNMPGIGSKFWRNPMDITNKAATDRTLVSGYTRVAPMEGDVVTAETLSSLLDQWQKDVRQQTESISHHPRYQMGNLPELGYLGGHPVVKLAVKYNGPAQTWQNGVPRTEPANCNTWWHATRSALVPSILAEGLSATIVSHGYKGLWVNTHAPSALCWTVNMLDPFPTVLFQLEIQKDILVHNSEVQAGSVHRSVACTGVGQTFPNLQIKAVALRIPTKSHRKWALGLRHAIMSTIIECTQNLDDQAKNQNLQRFLFREVWHVTAWRLCYHGAEGAMDYTFGGPFEQITPLSANLSLTITEIVAGLKAKNPSTKLRHLYNVPRDAVPRPILIWLLDKYPRIDSIFSPVSPTAVADGSIWDISTVLKVKPWKVVKYDLQTDLWI